MLHPPEHSSLKPHFRNISIRVIIFVELPFPETSRSKSSWSLGSVRYQYSPKSWISLYLWVAYIHAESAEKGCAVSVIHLALIKPFRLWAACNVLKVKIKFPLLTCKCWTGESRCSQRPGNNSTDKWAGPTVEVLNVSCKEGTKAPTWY